MNELEQLSSEQAADLAALQQSVNEAPLLPGEEPTPPPIDPAEALADEIAGIVLAVVAVIGPALPTIKKLYTPETTKAAAAAVAIVCVKHGWLSGGLVGDWAEEISAAFILLPLGVATYQGAKSDIANIKDTAAANLPAAQKPPPAVEASRVVTIGPHAAPEVSAGAGVSFGAPLAL